MVVFTQFLKTPDTACDKGASQAEASSGSGQPAGQSSLRLQEEKVSNKLHSEDQSPFVNKSIVEIVL